MSKGLMNLTLDFEVEVEYSYSPAEAESMEQPGCDESIQVESVNVLIAAGKYQTELSNYIEEMVWDVLNEEEREKNMERAESACGGDR